MCWIVGTVDLLLSCVSVASATYWRGGKDDFEGTIKYSL